MSGKPEKNDEPAPPGISLRLSPIPLILTQASELAEIAAN